MNNVPHHFKYRDVVVSTTTSMHTTGAPGEILGAALVQVEAAAQHLRQQFKTSDFRGAYLRQRSDYAIYVRCFYEFWELSSFFRYNEPN
eukprot:COSAG05_NODE_159_length_15652_cov_14.134636_13_plen_89_part_00